MEESNRTKITTSGASISTDITSKPKHERTLINILWTGGFDSTLRMLQLSKMEVEIQPYYLIDKRKSEKKELETISKILPDIVNHPQTRCTILPLIKFKVADLKPDIELSEAYQRLHANHLIGIQLDWLGRFAKQVPGIELSVEKSLLGHTYNCITQNGSLTRIKEPKHGYYVVDKKKSHPDLIKVFGNFHFPDLLFENTKMQMIDLYRELGFEHVILKTWFCHTPIKNKPCGVCIPCKAVMLEGLSFRLPPFAIRRYKFHTKYGHTRWCRALFKLQYKLA